MLEELDNKLQLQVDKDRKKTLLSGAVDGMIKNNLKKKTKSSL